MVSSFTSTTLTETYILVARICEHNDRETGEGIHRSTPFKVMNLSTILEGIALDEVGHDQDDQISDGDQGNDASVFQRIESPKER